MNHSIFTPSDEDVKELELYKREIILCLVRYGGLSERSAGQRVETDELFNVKNETELMLIFHEYPYYWAMMMLHAQSDSLWYQNPQLWPPPDDYFDQLSGQTNGVNREL